MKTIKTYKSLLLVIILAMIILNFFPWLSLFEKSILYNEEIYSALSSKLSNERYSFQGILYGYYGFENIFGSISILLLLGSIIYAIISYKKNRFTLLLYLSIALFFLSIVLFIGYRVTIKEEWDLFVSQVNTESKGLFFYFHDQIKENKFTMSNYGKIRPVFYVYVGLSLINVMMSFLLKVNLKKLQKSAD